MGCDLGPALNQFIAKRYADDRDWTSYIFSSFSNSSCLDNLLYSVSEPDAAKP
jgi:hypothetical protein